MAYMNQHKKAQIAANVTPVLRKYGLKGSLKVGHHSSIILTIRSGPIDFIGNCNKVCGSSHYQTSHGFRPITQGYTDVNTYWYQEHFDGIALDCLKELVPAMFSAGWYNRSDIQTDYFDVAYYVDIKIGRWDKPYQLIKDKVDALVD